MTFYFSKSGALSSFQRGLGKIQGASLLNIISQKKSHDAVSLPAHPAQIMTIIESAFDKVRIFTRGGAGVIISSLFGVSYGFTHPECSLLLPISFI